MPASSRKRNKGKDRKAKKAAKEEASKRIQIYNDWQNWARGLRADGTVVTQCNHGFDDVVLPEESHPVSRFISDYFSVDIGFSIILQRHPEVQNDDVYRKMAADILIRIGSNWLIKDNDRFGTNIPSGIMVLENYGKTRDYLSTVYSRDIGAKRRDISSRRDLLKFYRKRITCSCLKKMHLEARKTQLKVGECKHCGEVKERRLLMVCSRCMVDQYCSKECQVAAYPGHQKYCDITVKARQRIIIDST